MPSPQSRPTSLASAAGGAIRPLARFQFQPHQHEKCTMTLTTCPECSHSVSTAAASCPGCGHPLLSAGNQTLPSSPPSRVAENAKRWPWFRIGVFFFGLWFFLYGLESILKTLGVIDVDNDAISGFGIVVLVAGVPICLFGLLDKWALRPQMPETSFRPLNQISGGLFGIGILLVVIAMAIPGVNAAQRAGKPDGQARSEVARTITSPNDMFQISVPEDWKTNVSRDRPDQVGAESPRGILNARILPKTLAPNMTLKEWADTVLQASKQHAKVTRVSDPRPRTAATHPAIQRTLHGTTNGVENDEPVVITLVALETPENFYLVQLTTLESLFNQQEQERDAILESFRELTKPKQ